MRYRPHRRFLDEAIAETIELDGRPGLIAHLRRKLRDWPSYQFSDDAVKVESYGGDDERCGWKDVHIVTIDGYGVMGFCEGPAE